MHQFNEKPVSSHLSSFTAEASALCWFSQVFFISAMVIATIIEMKGYKTPYYWVDDQPYHMETMGVQTLEHLDPWDLVSIGDDIATLVTICGS